MKNQCSIAEQVELARLILRPERLGLDDLDNELMLDEAEQLARLVLEFHKVRPTEQPNEESHSSGDVALAPDARRKQEVDRNLDDWSRRTGIEMDSSSDAQASEELSTIYWYASTQTAANPGMVLPMPEIDRTKLTFGGVMTLFADLLATKTGGVHEQFITACLVHAKVEQNNIPGKRIERVKTKKITATDASSNTAGDIQIKSGPRVIDAYEVTANSWKEKIDGAKPTISAHDLSRIHIVAAVDSSDEMLADLRQRNEDISVLDLRHLVPVLVAELTKQFRAVALTRLYEYLDRSQGEPQLVNDYVQKLMKHGLAHAKATQR